MCCEPLSEGTRLTLSLSLLVMQAFTADVEAHERDLDRVEEMKDKFVGTAKVSHPKWVYMCRHY